MGSGIRIIRVKTRVRLNGWDFKVRLRVIWLGLVLRLGFKIMVYTLLGLYAVSQKKTIHHTSLFFHNFAKQSPIFTILSLTRVDGKFAIESS